MTDMMILQFESETIFHFTIRVTQKPTIYGRREKQLFSEIRQFNKSEDTSYWEHAKREGRSIEEHVAESVRVIISDLERMYPGDVCSVDVYFLNEFGIWRLCYSKYPYKTTRNSKF